MDTYTFTPTYLYIKQHSITGKLYFGKTIRNPEIYLGSGTYWNRHIKKHGKEHVITLWYCLFYDKESITDFAINFSKSQNIVESEKWLNLKPETGVDGGTIGFSSITKDGINRISSFWKGKPRPKSTKQILKHKLSIQCYEYVTPFGTFISSVEASKICNISNVALLKRCKFSDVPIKNSRSLKDKTNIGKTWKDLGYSLKSISNSNVGKS